MSIQFKNRDHERFYQQCLVRCGCGDPYHKAFFYTMGISDETRKHVEDVFDFQEDVIRPEGLNKGWQTSGSSCLTRLAFNLWNGWNADGYATPYGRQIPKHAHGTLRLESYTSSSKKILTAASSLFDKIVDKNLLVRRINIVAARVIPENEAPDQTAEYEQLDLFTDYTAVQKQREQEQNELSRKRKMQEAVLAIKKKYGKNSILKGMNLEDGATAKDRNVQIGGHKA